MKRGDITPLGSLLAGDCFYYLGDKNRLAYKIVKACDGKRKSAEVQNTMHKGVIKHPNSSTKVVFLHNSTPLS